MGSDRMSDWYHQRLREEMRIAVAIRHPNLMRLYGMFVDTTDIIPKVFTVRPFHKRCNRSHISHQN
jgi:hypothetical protein